MTGQDWLLLFVLGMLILIAWQLYDIRHLLAATNRMLLQRFRPDLFD